MQIFRYMVYIWEVYAKEAEKIHKDKKMGYLFEDMTLDIQQIRREAEEQLREAEEMREIAIELVVEAYRKMKISKDVVLKKIQDK